MKTVSLHFFKEHAEIWRDTLIEMQKRARSLRSAKARRQLEREGVGVYDQLSVVPSGRRFRRYKVVVR